jgi:amino acid adenylation domain-containing protein
MQIVTPPADVPLSCVDVSNVAPAARAAAIAHHAHLHARRAFDLGRGPLLRAALFACGPAEHILLLMMHHIVFDDASVPVLHRELTELYAAYHRGVAPRLAELPIAYPDFALWQRESLRAGDLAPQTAYWRDCLAGAPARIELPLDRARPAIQRFAGAVESSAIPAALAARVRELGRVHGASLFMTLLAAFKALLYRYTGQRDLVVGSPIANRTRSELEPLIGFFVNTLALRTKINGDLTFDELLRAVRETALSAYDNADVPFEQVIAELQPGRSLSGTPLVNVLFFVRGALGEPLSLDGLTVARFPLESTSSRFDLSLRVSERSDGLDCSLQYDTDLFDPATIRRMLRHFGTLLESIVAAPHAPIAQLELLSVSERERQIVTWNDTTTAFSSEQTLAELFEQQALRAPNAVAVRAGDGQVTYGELNAAANRLACALRAAGAQAGKRIGICMDRSIAMVVGMLAVLKTHAAYVPLDEAYPVERLSYMLRDADIRTVLARGGHAPKITDPAILVLDVDAPALQGLRAENVPSAGDPDAIAYVIYTSGSTGRPKGVLIGNRAVSRLVTGTDYVRITSADVVAQVSSFSFDTSVFDIFGALLNGARLEIIEREVSLAPAAFAAALRARGISVMFLPAALFRLIASTLPAAFAGLRCLLVGGEKLDPAAARAVLEAGPPGQVLNAYGPTEATVFACTYEVGLPVPTPVPIGRPIANTQAYVLDADRNIVPPGVTGQLYLGGPGIAHGYLNEPELTARAFVAHRFTSAAAARLYATGDLARYRPDGTLEFLGRLDRQVKIRGFRIEIDEIERALGDVAGVRDAVVDVRTNEHGDRRLIAYVIDAERAQRTPQFWRRVLGDRLPDYMLPSSVVNVAAFPLTPNGKIDLDALPDPRTAADGHVAPSGADPRARWLVDLWRDVLGVAQIDAHDNFFDLGGDSLSATRMIAGVAQHARPVPLAAFLRNPTIDHLATLLDADDEGTSPLLDLRATGTKTPFFFCHGDLSHHGAYTHKIARRLAGGQPFYVLSPHGQAGRPLPPTIQAMARDYVENIRMVRPVGPYVIGGFCGGGLVAFEIARQLRAANAVVHNVILIDAPGAHGRFAALLDRLDAVPLSQQRRRFIARRVFGSAGLLGDTIGKIARDASGLRLLTMLGRTAVDRLRQRLRRATHPQDELAALHRAWDWIVASYVPRRYAGRVTLLLPADDYAYRSTWIAGWTAVAERLAIGIVPGSHLSCITDFGDDLARMVSSSLETGGYQ